MVYPKRQGWNGSTTSPKTLRNTNDKIQEEAAAARYLKLIWTGLDVLNRSNKDSRADDNGDAKLNANYDVTLKVCSHTEANGDALTEVN